MKRFFYPESVVVIGVSRRPITVGRIILRNLVHCGYTGQVHAVGKNGGVALGRPIYTSLKDVPGPVDLAVVVTPAGTVPGIVRECGELGIQRIVVETAGFSELSDDLKGLEEELLAVSEAYGIRFIGPNCIGIINTENNLVTPFIQLRENLKGGKISIVSQSGGIAKTYWDHLFAEGLCFNKIMSVGNMLNVDEADLLDYLTNEDEGTETVCMYLEGFGSGRRFMEIARQSPKPIIVHKSATASAAIASAASHTTALSGDDKVVDAVFKQSGVVRAHSMVEMFDYAKIFEYPPMRGRNLAIVTRSGGHGVIAADIAEKCGFNLPALAPELIAKIRTELGGGVINLRNPLDLGDMYDVALLERITRLVLSSSKIDGAVLIHGYGIPQTKVTLNLVKNLKLCGQELEKPVAISMFVDSQEMAALKQQAELPLFDTPENAVKALDVSCRVHASREKRLKSTPFVKEMDNTAARRMVEKAISEKRNPAQHECFEILGMYGLRVPSFRRIQTTQEATQAAEELTAPMVLKIDVPSILHKSEVDGVVLNLHTPEAVASALDAMEERLADHIKPNGPFAAILMEQVDSEGLEVILGSRQDSTFGPTILFGLGGIFVELLDEVSLRVLPVDRNEIEEMIQETRGYPVLTGVRGLPSLDVEGLRDNLLSLAQLTQDFEQIREIDLNPVLVTQTGCFVLDARFLV